MQSIMSILLIMVSCTLPPRSGIQTTPPSNTAHSATTIFKDKRVTNFRPTRDSTPRAEFELVYISGRPCNEFETPTSRYPVRKGCSISTPAHPKAASPPVAPLFQAKLQMNTTPILPCLVSRTWFRGKSQYRRCHQRVYLIVPNIPRFAIRRCIPFSRLGCDLCFRKSVSGKLLEFGYSNACEKSNCRSDQTSSKEFSPVADPRGRQCSMESSTKCEKGERVSTGS